MVARAFALGLLMIRVGLRRSVFRTGDVRDCVAFLAAALELELGGFSSPPPAAAIRRALGCEGQREATGLLAEKDIFWKRAAELPVLLISWCW